MQLQYNGITLDVLKLHSWTRKAISDARGNFLFTRHVLHVQCLYNPSLNSYEIAGEQPQSRFGKRGRITDLSLRHFLLQPKQAFIFQIDLDLPQAFDNDSKTVLSSNLGDVTTGPMPLECNVTSVAGMKTFFVDYIIQVDVMDRDAFDGEPGSPIISHTVQVEEELDERLMITRTFTGTVVFRRDQLNALGTEPDQYRKHFISASPEAGFRTTDLRVRAEPDGVTVHYQHKQQQMFLSWPYNRVHRLELGWAVDEHVKGRQEMIHGSLGSVAQTASAVVGHSTNAMHKEGWARKSMAALAVVTEVASFVERATPSYSISGAVKLWGGPKARPVDLITAGGPLLERMEKWIREQLNAGGYSVISKLAVDETGRYAELNRTWAMPRSSLPDSSDSANLAFQRVQSSLFKIGNYPPTTIWEPDLLKGEPNGYFSNLATIPERIRLHGSSASAIVAGVLSSAGTTPEAFDLPRLQQVNP